MIKHYILSIHKLLDAALEIETANTVAVSQSCLDFLLRKIAGLWTKDIIHKTAHASLKNLWPEISAALEEAKTLLSPDSPLLSLINDTEVSFKDYRRESLAKNFFADKENIFRYLDYVLDAVQDVVT